MLVDIDRLTKCYQDVTALSGCSLQIQPGEVFGLLGPNGAGKTTLLRLLMGFLRPTSGSAHIEGLDCYTQSVEVHRRVTYLPGDVRLFRHMRARQLLQFFCRVRKANNLPQAIEVAEHLDLDLDRRVSNMSTGMRQKLALAATLSATTPLVILDEPTANLDPNVRSCVAEMVRQAGVPQVARCCSLLMYYRKSKRLVIAWRSCGPDDLCMNRCWPTCDGNIELSPNLRSPGPPYRRNSARN